MHLNYTMYSERDLPPNTTAMDTPGNQSASDTGFSAFLDLSFPFMTTTESYAAINDSHFDISNGTDSNLDISDFWTFFNSENLRQSIGWSIALILAYAVIIVTGSIGNFLVILVMIFKSPMKKVTTMFLTNLAVADLIVSVFCVPSTLLSNLFTPWILGSFMCKGSAYVQGVSVCGSAYSLAALSLDRCKAIYRPMERRQGLSKYQALMTILLIWIFSLLITLPWLFAFDVIKSEEDGQVYCLESWENEHLGRIYFLVAQFIFCYCVPLMIICFSNIAIWCHVSHREVPQDSALVRRMHKKTRHGVRKTLGTVTLAFVISWLPLYALGTYIKFKSVHGFGDWEGTVLSVLLPIAQWLGSSNSCMNPILYTFINSKFRKGFLSLLHSLGSKEKFSTKRVTRPRRSQKTLRRSNAFRQRSLAHNRIEARTANNGNVGVSASTDV